MSSDTITPTPTPTLTPAPGRAPEVGTRPGARVAGEGREIGPYRLGPLLGRGGMSEVYEAVDGRTGAPVALKLVQAGDAALTTRLVQEGRVLARLSHPGLVALLDAGAVDERGYLVMELVRGGTLAAMATGPLPPARVAALGAQVADALAYVHAQGVVHRDLKPSNILVGEDGRARIGDFGVSRLLDASTITVAGTTLGTVAYMAPEQLEGQRVGAPADVWSLGLVLLECLQGHRVYRGPPAEVVARRLAAPVPLPADLPVPWRLLLEGMVDHRASHRLTAHQVEALLTSGPFDEPWAGTGAAGAGAGREADPDSAVVVPVPAGHGDDTWSPAHDLTALAPNAATALLAPDATRPRQVPATGHRRRLWIAAGLCAAAVAAGALGAGGVVAVHDLRGGHPPGQAGRLRGAATTTVPPTTTTLPTTTTVPAGQSALDALTTDLAGAESAGGIDPALAGQVSADAQRAVADAQSGDSAGASGMLRQATSLVTRGARDATVDLGTASTIEDDLSTLDSALGLDTSAAVPPPTPSPTTPSPFTTGSGRGSSNGNGNGHGG
ncbi:MAG TPA: serine/threonine-protein kinase [Acidimicrobiales bacterium]|nr:serine/threonine-protein kinase [Acidimicrobiales bacterium]